MAPKRKSGKSKSLPAQVNETKSLFIGIDLGTNHTAISTSDGKKNSILSVVGTPRDAVASKFLEKERLYGEETLRHRGALNLFRPIEVGVLKIQKEDIEAAKVSKVKDPVFGGADGALKLARDMPDEFWHTM